MCSNYPEIELEPALGTKEDKIEHLPSYAHVVHTTAKQVISRRRKNENVFKMSKNENCTCGACKNFHCQICKFVGVFRWRRRNSCLSSLLSIQSEHGTICTYLAAETKLKRRQIKELREKNIKIRDFGVKRADKGLITTVIWPQRHRLEC